MGKIRFVDASQRQFVSGEERARSDSRIAEILKRFPPGERSAASFVHHKGDTETPQLFEVRLDPHTTIESHVHDVDEIIVVTAGEARFGKRTYGPGSSVFIPKMTLYSFQADPDGLTFMNFRPTKGSYAIFKDEFVASRTADSRK